MGYAIIASYAGWLLVALLWLGGFFVFSNAGMLPDPRILIPAALLFHLWAAGLSLRFMAEQQDRFQKQREWVRLMVMGGMAVCWAVLGWGIDYSQGMLRVVFYLILSAHLMTFAAYVGTWLGRHVEKAVEFLPVCIVIGLADAFSVWKGPTRIMAETLSSYYSGGMAGPVPWVDHLVIKMIIPGIGQPVPVFGITDWVMVAMLVSSAHRVGCDDNFLRRFVPEKFNRYGYLPLATLGLVVAYILAQETGFFLPALPVIAVCFWVGMAVGYPDVRAVGRRELGLSVAAICFFGLVAVLLG